MSTIFWNLITKNILFTSSYTLSKQISHLGLDFNSFKCRPSPPSLSVDSYPTRNRIFCSTRRVWRMVVFKLASEIQTLVRRPFAFQPNIWMSFRATSLAMGICFKAPRTHTGSACTHCLCLADRYSVLEAQQQSRMHTTFRRRYFSSRRTTLCGWPVMRTPKIAQDCWS